MNQITSHDWKWLEDPTIFEVNRLKAHSDHFEGEKQSLNGLWYFSYSRNLKSASETFFQIEEDVRSWGTIKVPGHMELQGYDHPHYVNTMYPWDAHEDLLPPQVPTIYNPVGSYVNYFTLEEALKDRPIYISFQGVESAFYIWLNGYFIGYSEDSFTPAEFDLTPFIKEGENKLAVRVVKWCSGSWLEDQDFWRLSGIFRDVYLYAMPEVHIRDLSIKTDLDDKYQDGTLEVNLELLYEKVQNTVLEIYLKDATGKEVLRDTQLLSGDTNERWLGEMKQVNLWSSEYPYLYELELIIKSLDTGGIIEKVRQKVGFRKLEMIGNIMHINGKRIVFRGVNRHEFSCYYGRSITEEEMLWDIKTLKQNNFNSVRTSHYPNQSRWYELCDEYGIYVIDEANIESHGTWQHQPGYNGSMPIIPGDRQEWLGSVLDRGASMVQRDKNHPAIVIWSCGNEANGGEVLYRLSEYFRQTDSSRFVHYEGVIHDRRYNDTSDMESRMYETVENVKKYLEDHPQKPFILCEYSHAMGNSNGALHKYTELEDEYPMYQGGFIWDYIDQGIMMKDAYGKDYLAYGGDFNDYPTDYNFCVNGLVYADRKVSPKMQEVKYLYQSYVIIPTVENVYIRNKSLFTSTDEYSCQWHVKKDGFLYAQGELEIQVMPQSEAVFNLPIPELREAGEYVIEVSLCLKEDTLWAKRGYEIAFGQHIYQIANKEVEEVKKEVQLVKGDYAIGVRGEHFHIIFSKNVGALASIKYGGEEMLKAPIMPNFWRAMTDNDRGNGAMCEASQWKLASLYAQYVDVKATCEDNKVRLKVTYKLPTSPVSECSLTYTVDGNGKVQIDMYYPGSNLPSMPLYGVSFKLSHDYNQLTWYGNGKEETYSDRKHGAKLGIYRQSVQEAISAYVIPQECGNKTDVRWATLVNASGNGIKLRSDTPFEMSALPYTCHELENAMHHYELPPVYYTVINVCKMQMGVGGDDSWGAKTHPEYCIATDKPLDFTFYIEPFFSRG